MPLKPPGSDWDVNGCITSAGYSWCDILGRCIRAWEQSCDYPQNCLSWFDGCNTCSLVEGADEVGGLTLGICTEMYCFSQETPYCSVPKPEVSIEPWLQNPPVVNPFQFGGGHR